MRGHRRAATLKSECRVLYEPDDDDASSYYEVDNQARLHRHGRRWYAGVLIQGGSTSPKIAPGRCPRTTARRLPGRLLLLPGRGLLQLPDRRVHVDSENENAGGTGQLYAFLWPGDCRAPNAGWPECSACASALGVGWINRVEATYPFSLPRLPNARARETHGRGGGAQDCARHTIDGVKRRTSATDADPRAGAARPATRRAAAGSTGPPVAFDITIDPSAVGRPDGRRRDPTSPAPLTRAPRPTFRRRPARAEQQPRLGLGQRPSASRRATAPTTSRWTVVVRRVRAHGLRRLRRGLAQRGGLADECAEAVRAFDGQDDCRAEFFFYEDEGRCNCPTDVCELNYERKRRRGGPAVPVHGRLRLGRTRVQSGMVHERL